MREVGFGKTLWMLAALVVVPTSLAGWLAVASPNGDLNGKWTDHLRHEGEALALEQRGLGMYLLTYDEATRGGESPMP